MTVLRAAIPAALAVALLTPVSAARTGEDAMPAAKAQPRHQLLGDWQVGGVRHRFGLQRGAVAARVLERTRLRGCAIRRGTVVFKSYSFSRARSSQDRWEGLALAVEEESCERDFVPSSITLENDVRMVEHSPRAGLGARAFRRIRPEVQQDDEVVGTWLRNAAGIVVVAEGGRYVGRAREAYLIANGCTIPAGTMIWRLDPVAPGRYAGSIQTFLLPPTCRPGVFVKSDWKIDEGGRTLLRIASDGQVFPYDRAPPPAPPPPSS